MRAYLRSAAITLTALFLLLTSLSAFADTIVSGGTITTIRPGVWQEAPMSSMVSDRSRHPDDTGHLDDPARGDREICIECRSGRWKRDEPGSARIPGTSTSRIAFTRNATSGTWTGITFNDATVDATTVIEYADIQYSTGIVMTSASPVIRNSTITNVSGSGMNLTSSHPTLQNATISSINGYGLNLSSSNPALDAVTITANGTSGVNLYLSSPQ